MRFTEYRTVNRDTFLALVDAIAQQHSSGTRLARQRPTENINTILEHAWKYGVTTRCDMSMEFLRASPKHISFHREGISIIV